MSVESTAPGPTAPSPAKGKKTNNYFDGLDVTKKHKLVFFIIMLAYFFEQMDNWNFGFIASAIFSSWGLEGMEANRVMSHIVFWYFIGMTAGGFLGGVISDIIGRRKTFLLSITLFSVCSIINGLPINSLTVFIIARSLTGFGVFCLMVCSQTYIAEMAPAESRGKWQGLVAAVGFTAVPIIAFLCRVIVPLHAEAWRIIFCIGGTGLIALVVAYKYLLESPRWLVSQNRQKEAESVVEQITGQSIDLSQAASMVVSKVKLIEIISGMFTRKYIGRTLLILLIFITITPAGFTFTTWTAKLLSGIPAIDPITNLEILDAAGRAIMIYDQTTMLTIMTIISCGVPAGCFLASLIADKGGRKIPMICMLIAAAISALLFAKYAATSAYLAALFGFFFSVFNMAGSFILFSYTAESYPTHMRNTATGGHNGLARLSVSGFQYVIPIIIAAFGGTIAGINYDIPAIFTTCAILFAIPIPFIILFGKRTSCKSLEDIT